MEDLRGYLGALRDAGELDVRGLDTKDGYVNVQIDCENLSPDPAIIQVLSQEFKQRNGDAALDVLADEIEAGEIMFQEDLGYA